MTLQCPVASALMLLLASIVLYASVVSDRFTLHWVVAGVNPLLAIDTDLPSAAGRTRALRAHHYLSQQSAQIAG